jgi:hypothetical protein
MGRGWKRAMSAPRQSLTRQTTLDELKTHLRGAQIVLRSKTPDLSNYPLRPRKRQCTHRIDFAKRIRIVK